MIMSNENNEYKPTYAILLPGEATDWRAAVNDNQNPLKKSRYKKIIWVIVAVAIIASLYFIF